MPIPATPFALFAVLITSTVTATAQQAPAQPDSTRAQIHTSLRAFYLNLAHQNWEALTADVLPAKVVAHRPAPQALVLAATSPGRSAGPSFSADDPLECSSKTTALIDQATITLDGDWAEVSVPRCAAGPGAADEFRLIHFEERWRFVYIDLFQERVNVSTDR